LINKFNNKLIIFCLILGVLFFAHIDTFAEEKEDKKDFIEIEADSMDYDYTNDRYHAQGAVVINYKDMHLNADDVNLDNKSKVATAQGNVFLKMGEDYLKGDKVIFNIENQTGVAYEGQVFYERNHFYVKGDKIEKKGENTYFIEQPRATTCDGESPDWEIAGSEMDVTIEGYGKVKDARFLTKGLPIFILPSYFSPPRQKGNQDFCYLIYLIPEVKMAWILKFPFFGQFLLKWTRHFIRDTWRRGDTSKAWNLDIFGGIIRLVPGTAISWKMALIMWRHSTPEQTVSTKVD